ncbi:AMP-binding protein [Alicyclobacillus acidiphilus]|uniref:AMP-binding protein n=1 Tax=Alicyclobacillus acidiphilus TaxID=182455 RepID=UPI00082D2348|nr:AMP-binding protein [Alicyclobacillus acidiphilus]
MKALSTRSINFAHKAIYLLNCTIHTNFREVLSHVPEDMLICIDNMVHQRYGSVLEKRVCERITAENPWTFRQLIGQLRAGKPVLVALDTNQATFQAVSRHAFATGIPIIPIYGHERPIRIADPLPLTDARTTLDELQRFLLMSYLGRPDDGEVNLFNELLDAARYYGEDRVICKDISGEVTYKQLLLNTYVLSQRLKSLACIRSRVGVMLPNSIGNAVTLFALFRNGCTPVMLNYSAGVQTILDACETADIKTILTSKEFIKKGQLDHVEQALTARYRVIYLEDVRKTISLAQKASGYLAFRRRARVRSTNNEVILFTSGSEYKPRGVVLSHDNIFANVQQTRSVIDFGTSDRMLNAMPMFHSFGLTAGALLPLVAGIQTYLYPSPLHYKRIPELVGEQQSTILFGTSSFLEKYGQNALPEHFASLRYAVVGAERLKPEVDSFWRSKFGIQIMQGYGATETSPIMCLDTPINHKDGTVGRFLPGMSHRLIPVEGITQGGRLQVQGPNVMKGYLQYGTGYVAQEGWYDTGDVVWVDEDGFVTIIGRLKRFAKISGEMVSLNLVEQLAAKAYGSTEFAAINLPDKARGERIVLVTTLSDIDLGQIRELVDSLGYSKLHVPSEVRRIDEFPLLGSGKTDYVALNAMYSKN